MALHIHFGSSGSGKTYELISFVTDLAEKNPEGSFFFVVPEQFTLGVQKEFIKRSRNHGILNIDVSSLTRLAFRLFEEKGGNDRVLLDDAGKSMIVKKLLIELGSELGVYGANASKQGFVEEIKSVISEFSQYKIDDADLDRMIALADGKPLMRNKLRDIKKIYGAYREFLSEHYITGEEILDVACAAAEESKLLEACTICLDGFTGFSPSQYDLIEVLLRRANDVHVTLTMCDRDTKRELRESDLFYLSYSTAHRLKEISARACVDVRTYSKQGDPVRFCNSPALAHLEKNIFRRGGAAFEGENEDIVFLNCRDRHGEVSETVCEIKKLLRSGLAGSEIAIVCSDVAEYGRLLEAEFDRLKIPCFVDMKKDFSGTKLAETVRAAIEVSKEDYSYESVFRMLKSGFGIISPAERDELENYCLALGIRGRSAWAKEWKWTYRTVRPLDLEAINKIRAKVYEYTSELDAVLRDRGATVSDKLRAVYSFAAKAVTSGETTTDLRSGDAITQASERQSRGADAGARGFDLEEEREFEQTAAIFAGVLDRLESLLGDEVLSADEFSAILDTGFKEAKLRRLPPTSDSIIIGDIERTRLENIKVLFFLGVSDARIPKEAKSGGVLSDADREYLADNDFELAPTARQRSYLAEFYLYLNMTKPSQRLYLSYCSLDDSGKPVKPSYVIDRVRKLFANVPEKTDSHNGFTDGEELYDRMLSSDGGLLALMSAAGENSKVSRSIIHTLYEENHREHGEMLDRVLKACSEDASSECIDREHAAELYGKVLLGSISRLESYASCAFAHFVRYGLRLEERRLYEIDSRDVGTLTHGVLENFCKSLKRDGISWRKLDGRIKKEYIAKSIADVANDYGNGIMMSSARNEYMTKILARIMERTVDTIETQIKAGDMEPAFFEESFEHVGRYMKLSGKIDRIDVCEKDGKIFLRIVDYKTGRKTLDLEKLYYGLSLQLGVYMKESIKLADRGKGARVVPAGMYYYQVDDPLINTKEVDEEKTREEIDLDIAASLKMNGLTNSSAETVGVQDRQMIDETGSLKESMASRVIDIKTGKDGRLSGFGNARTGEILGLSDYLEAKMEEGCEKILEGDTRALPYRLGGKTGCEYCPYLSVCGFGTRGSQRYRVLRKIKDAEVWSSLPKVQTEEELEPEGLPDAGADAMMIEAGVDIQ